MDVIEQQLESIRNSVMSQESMDVSAYLAETISVLIGINYDLTVIAREVAALKWDDSRKVYEISDQLRNLCGQEGLPLE